MNLNKTSENFINTEEDRKRKEQRGENDRPKPYQMGNYIKYKWITH